MSFPKYPKYKDSGVEWLGQVPEHWATVPCRAIVREQTAKNDGASCEDYLSVMANVGVIPYEEKGDVGNKKPEDLSKCKLVSSGDFVINSMNYGIGSYGISAYDGVCSPVYIVLTPRLDVVESRFAFRIFENRAFQTYAQSFGNGILAHRCAINWDILKPIGIPVPPMSEQRGILAFLDRETSKIDGLIAEQQRLIELLQEKRQAVISHAVTKGLNPDAPMKDSGIEWLGAVPEHWNRIRIKYCLHGLIDTEHKTAPFFEDGEYLVVRTTNVKNGQLVLEDAKYTDNATYVEWTRRGTPKVGDIMFTREAPAGEACVVPAGIPLCMGQRTVLMQIDHDLLDAQFALWSLYGGLVSEFVVMLSQGSTVAHFNMSDIGNIPLMLPTFCEQREIARRLNIEIDWLVELAAEAHLAITLLQERRSALISAAVTGQIDVRGLAGAEAA